MLYTLPLAPVLGAILAYAILLWFRPAAFLIALPIALPAFDLGLWTGWSMLTEADLCILVTLGVLALRAPPTRADLLPARLPLLALSAMLAVTATATAIGLATHAEPSDNLFLRPDNALRLAKALIEAIALLPFIRRRERTHADALDLLAWGMIAGLCVVTLQAMAERALFAGVFDFASDYRVAAAFSSMRVGGGHIGAYVALALPFLFACRLPNRQAPTAALIALAGVAGLYTLIVTYARTGYLAGLAGMGIAALAWLAARRYRDTGRIPAMVPIALVAAFVAAIGIAASSTVMRDRIGAAAADLLTRQDNWRAGWAQRDSSILGTIFGSGLGTYQRMMREHSTVNRPSDLVLESDGTGRFATIKTSSVFFLGQKIPLPAAGDVVLTLSMRSDGGSRLGILLCDKVLLYSDQCRGADPVAPPAGQWQTVTLRLKTEGLGRSALGGLLRRPVELSLFNTSANTALSLRDIRLTDEAGGSLLSNGDFARGLDRWIFTDDTHVAWRILNQYLMTLFETGLLGLAALAGLIGVAGAGALRAVRRGDPMGAAVLGAIGSFLVSGLFDNVLEAPRVATLFYLACCVGLILFERSVALDLPDRPNA